MSGRERRPVGALIADLLDACDAAADIVERGKTAWNEDRLHPLAGEAVVGRLGDAAAKLPTQVTDAIPEVPWSDVIGLRIRVDHVYHRLDYDTMWETLYRDVPALRAAVSSWRTRDSQ
ncbi:MAG: DUF86 domain-containing protein [Nitriliruptorales bacterium]|nr:DUF86 domain-containing protein [Nitriliruptorales bacterium]